MFKDTPEGSTNSYTPITEAVKDMEREFNLNFFMHSNYKNISISAKDYKSHITATIIKVLEAMKTELELMRNGVAISKPYEVPPEMFDLVADQTKFARNDLIDEQIDLIDKTLGEIK